VVALTLLGFLKLANRSGELWSIWRKAARRIPAVRAIYRGVKQVFETLFSGTGSSFRRGAWFEFPSPGMWSMC